MNTATHISDELTKEYLRFKNFDESKMDFIDQLRMYESLTNKLDEAGISFYDLSVHALQYLKSA